MEQPGPARAADRADELAAALAAVAGSETCGPTSAERARLLESLLGRAACRRLGIYVLPDDFLLSVVIPVFNERRTIGEVVQRVRGCGLPLEMIIVDDGSTDGTRAVLAELQQERDIRVVLHEQNRGKGAALRSGFALARGNVVMVQDADLEYDPAEYARLIQPIVENQADVVYGSRFAGDNHRVLYFWHYLGNRLLTLCSNALTNLNLTDMETGSKAFRREAMQQVVPHLREDRFGIEPELTAKIASLPGIRIHECSITYQGRTYAEGKKITWRDGIRALWCIVRYAGGIR